MDTRLRGHLRHRSERILATSALGQWADVGHTFAALMYLASCAPFSRSRASRDKPSYMMAPRRAGDEGKMGSTGNALASTQRPAPSPQPLSRIRERGYGKTYARCVIIRPGLCWAITVMSALTPKAAPPGRPSLAPIQPPPILNRAAKAALVLEQFF